MIKNSTCPICNTLRPLSDHLYEMFLFCMYLENSIVYSESDETREVHTLVIGNWLRLASQLETVEINAWKFAEDNALWCSTVADRYDIDSKMFTIYSTTLTRFIYVCYALEETYRFVSPNYLELIKKCNQKQSKKIKKCSIQSAYLIDQLNEEELPAHFDHIVGNFTFYFDKYYQYQKPVLTGLNGATKKNPSYGLHLIRNLRNHVAHGLFPLMNEFIEPDEPPSISVLVNVLYCASRSAILYIQALIKKYCNEFKSYEYKANENGYGEEFDNFIENCTMRYALSLHKQGKFSLHKWM